MAIDLAGSVWEVLNANTALTTLCTGGIHNLDDLPVYKFQKKDVPELFDASNRIKLFAVVKGRSVGFRQDVLSVKQQVRTVNQIVEVHLKQDRGFSRDNFSDAEQLIFNILEGARADRVFFCSMTNYIPEFFDKEMANARSSRFDFNVVGYIKNVAI